MYDPYRRLMSPDFEARNELPQWQKMGGEDQGEQITGAAGSFVDLLKQRMARPGAPKVAMPDAAVNPSDPTIPIPKMPEFGKPRSDSFLMHGGGSETGTPLLRETDLGGKSPMMGGKAGGMQSL